MGHHIPLAALALFAHGRFGLRRTKGAADAAHFMDKVGNVMQFSLTETNQVIHALILAHLGKVAGVS